MLKIFNEMLNDFNNLCNEAGLLIMKCENDELIIVKGENDENKTKD